MSTSGQSSEPLARRDYAVAVVLALAVVIGGMLRMVPGVVGVFSDDAVYAVTAKALAEGRGYRLLNVPDAPPQTKYPILYPALLALAWWPGASLEERLIAMQAVTLALAALAIAASYLYCVRFGAAARSAAFAGALLAASAPNVLFYSVQPLSEMPFALLLITALWTSERLMSQRSAAHPASVPASAETQAKAQANAKARPGAKTAIAARDFAAGIVLGLPFLCRLAGIVVPLVVVPWLLLRGRRAVWVAAGAAAAILPWVAWMAYWRGAADPIVGYQTDYLGWWLRHDPLAGYAQNIVKAFVAFSHIAFEGIVHGLYARTEWARTILTVAGALVWLCAAVRLRTRALPAVILVAYLALICLWPWPPDRFLVPVLVLLGALGFEALRRAAARAMGERGATAAVALVLVAMVGANAALLRRYSAVSETSRYPYFLLPHEPVRWKSYREAFDWLREHVTHGEATAAGFDSMTALYTERPALRPYVADPGVLYYGREGPPLGTVADFDAILDRYAPRYLFLSPMPSFPEEEAFYELVGEVERARPGRLRLVYRGADPRFAIYEVVRADR